MAEYIILSFRDGAPGVRRQLYRKVYGYSLKGVKYPGLLSKCNGLKLGAGAIITPASCRQPFEEVLTSLKVEFFTLSVMGDEKLLDHKNNQNSANRQLFNRGIN